MCVSRQKPRLEAENLLPQPRLYVLMPRLGLASPRDYCLGIGLVSSASVLPRLVVMKKR